jgi:hypothetical protein
MEHYRKPLQSLGGTNEALLQREWKAASTQLVDAAEISIEAVIQLCISSIMIIMEHFLKDTRAGYKQKYYIERHLFLRKQTGVRDCIDRLDIVSTYLALYPPI